MEEQRSASTGWGMCVKILFHACQTVLIDQQKKWEQIVLFRRVAGNKVPKDVI